MPAWISRPWGGEHTPPTPNPFAGLADYFDGGEADPTDRGWLVYKPDAVAEAVVSVGMDLEPVRGGNDPAGSLWFSQNAATQITGFLIYKAAGPGSDMPVGFDARARLVATNSAGDDDPPVAVGEYRYVVLAVHDPDRSTDLNYVHIGIGADPDGLQVEVKTTDSDGVTAQSVFPVEPAMGTGSGLFYDVRIVRRTTDSRFLDCYYRPSSGALTTDSGWVLHTTINRSDNTQPPRGVAVDLPDDVQIGVAVYASPEVHDIHGRVLGFVVLPTED